MTSCYYILCANCIFVPFLQAKREPLVGMELLEPPVALDPRVDLVPLDPGVHREPQDERAEQGLLGPKVRESE